MTNAELSDMYRGYIACLNAQDWQNLGKFVGEDVHYNGKRIGLSGYREMLEGDFSRHSRSPFQHQASRLRTAIRGQPPRLPLHTERQPLRPAGQRAEGLIQRERIL